jgi:type II secretory pathway pseudopilin PulG
MLIVVAIMAIVSAAVAIGAMKHFLRVKVETAETNARTVREAVKTFWIKNDDPTCPTVDQLIADGELDEGSPRKDPWGTAWRIECSDERVHVISDGPDRKSGTEDDIHVPPKTT